MDVRKSPAEAGLSRSPSKRTCPPDCPSPTRSEGTAQSSGIGGKPPELKPQARYWLRTRRTFAQKKAPRRGGAKRAKNGLPTASATGRLTHGLPRAAGSVATAAYVGTNPKLGFIRRRRFTTTSCSAFETFSKPPPETVHHQGRTPESRIERTVGHARQTR